MPDPEAHRAELEACHERDRSPLPRAESFGLHDLIDPRETRPVSVTWVRLAQRFVQTSLGQKRYTMRPERARDSESQTDRAGTGRMTVLTARRAARYLAASPCHRLGWWCVGRLLLPSGSPN